MKVGNRQQQLATLNELGEVLNREAEFENALPAVLGRLVELLGLSCGWVFLSNTSHGDAHQGSFSLAATEGLPPALEHNQMQPLCSGSCECQGLFGRGKLDRSVNMVTCSRLAKANGDRGGLELHASVPLLGAQGPVGILNLAAPGNARFDEETLTFLAAAGKQLGVAFERSRLQAQRTREARYTATLEERERLARQMHDSLSQLLFAADLSLQAALSHSGGERATPALQRAADSVSAALAELHGLVEVQRPADLSSGLVPALARLAQRTGNGPITVHLDAQELEVSGSTGEAIYRIAQEAVGNSLRHCHGENIWIRLQQSRDQLVFEVRDDGRGFEVESAQGGLGLSGMRERASKAGGTLEIASGPQGTTVRAVVPWRG